MSIRRARERAALSLFTLLSLALLASGTVAIACSSTTSDASPAPSDGGGSDAAFRDGGADAPADIDAAPAEKIGALFAISDSTTVDGGARGRYRAGGFFARTISPDTTVTTKTVGPCILETVGDGMQAKEEPASAGIVRLEGGKTAIALMPKADKSYAAISGTEALWSGGETLTVRATGQDVPPFMATLEAPSKITLTAPNMTAAGDLTVSRSGGVSAVFNGASSGAVVLYFDIAASSNAFTATCTFDVSSGTARVPASAFADFPAGEGTFDFYMKESVVATPPGWNVRFTASSAIVDASGASLAGRATFQ